MSIVPLKEIQSKCADKETRRDRCKSTKAVRRRDIDGSRGFIRRCRVHDAPPVAEAALWFY